MSRQGNDPLGQRSRHQPVARLRSSPRLSRSRSGGVSYRVPPREAQAAGPVDPGQIRAQRLTGSGVGTIVMSIQTKKFAIAREGARVGLGKGRPLWHDGTPGSEFWNRGSIVFG